MNIYGFIDDNFWPKKREAQKNEDHLWLHWWSFLTKKKRGAQNQYLIDIIFDKKEPFKLRIHE